nr:hypothetical protein [Xanthomonas arboricola]
MAENAIVLWFRKAYISQNAIGQRVGVLQLGIVGILVILALGIGDHACPGSRQVRTVCDLFAILLLSNRIRIVAMIGVGPVVGQISLNMHPAIRQSRLLIAGPAADGVLVALFICVEKEFVMVLLAQRRPDVAISNFNLLVHDGLRWLTDS